MVSDRAECPRCPTAPARWRYRYDPWGALEYEQPGGVFNPLRYTGREWDAETGLYYNRARYYDPQVGRFISEDPIGLAGGINVYAYAMNDPVNLRDPLGLFPVQPCPRTSKGLAQAFKQLCEWYGFDNPFILNPAKQM